MTSGSDAEKLAARYYAAGHWSRGSIWQSFEAAAASQGRHAVVIDDEGTVGLPALLDRARRIAGGFALAGLAHGDTVLIQSRNRMDAFAAILACFAGGYVAAPLPPIFSTRQVAAVARSSGARGFLLFDGDAASRPSDVTGHATGDPVVFVPDAMADGTDGPALVALRGRTGITRAGHRPGCPGAGASFLGLDGRTQGRRPLRQHASLRDARGGGPARRRTRRPGAGRLRIRLRRRYRAGRAPRHARRRQHDPAAQVGPRAGSSGDRRRACHLHPADADPLPRPPQVPGAGQHRHALDDSRGHGRHCPRSAHRRDPALHAGAAVDVRHVGSHRPLHAGARRPGGCPPRGGRTRHRWRRNRHRRSVRRPRAPRDPGRTARAGPEPVPRLSRPAGPDGGGHLARRLVPHGRPGLARRCRDSSPSSAARRTSSVAAA